MNGVHALPLEERDYRADALETAADAQLSADYEARVIATATEAAIDAFLLAIRTDADAPIRIYGVDGVPTLRVSQWIGELVACPSLLLLMQACKEAVTDVHPNSTREHDGTVAHLMRQTVLQAAQEYADANYEVYL